MNRVWAWVWLACLVLLGWVPALLVSYGVAFALAVGAHMPGRLVFEVVYALILLTGVAMAVQVRRFFALSGREAGWYTWAGGTALVGVWGGAFGVFTISTGILP